MSLGLFVAAATAVTVLVISFGCAQIVEAFPGGGGIARAGRAVHIVRRMTDKHWKQAAKRVQSPKGDCRYPHARACGKSHLVQ